MRWPSDRKFVDAAGKILDHWKGPLQRLEPLLDFTPAQFTALQALIAAAAEEEEEGGEDPTNPFALPIDEEPLSEDYLVGTKTSENDAGRRFPVSRFAPPMQLISSTPLTASPTDIPVPIGYGEFEILVSQALGSGVMRISFSEDGGTTFVNAAFYVQFSTGGATASAASATSDIGNLSGNDLYARIYLPDYTRTVNKFGNMTSLRVDGVLSWGAYAVLSTAPINAIQLTSAFNTITGGTVELWGRPNQ